MSSGRRRGGCPPSGVAGRRTTGIVRRGVYGLRGLLGASVTCYGCPSCLGARSAALTRWPGSLLVSYITLADHFCLRSASSNRLVWQHLCSECGLRALSPSCTS